MNILILFPYYFYHHKMSHVRRLVVDELTRTDECNAILTGPGWAGWDDDLELRENIRRIMPDCGFLFAYKPLGGKESRPLKMPRARSVPMCVSFNECYWQDWKALQECRDSGTDLVVCHHQNDMPQFDDGTKRTFKPKVVHIPHCTQTSLFAEHAKPFDKRSCPLVVTGILSPEIYPVRCRIADLVRRGAIDGRIVRHPGYRLSSLEACRAEAVRYAEVLGDSRVSVVCSSRYRYPLAKYVESAAAGCVVFGDVVPEFSDTLTPNMLAIRPDMTDDEIITSVNCLQQDVDHASRLASGGQRAAQRDLDVSVYVRRLLEAMRDYRC